MCPEQRLLHQVLRDGARYVAETNDRDVVPATVTDEVTQPRLALPCPVLLQDCNCPARLRAARQSPSGLYVKQELNNVSSSHFNKMWIQELWVSS